MIQLWHLATVFGFCLAGWFHVQLALIPGFCCCSCARMQLDIIQFFAGFRLKANGVQLVVRSDNKPTGEVRVMQ